MTACRDCQSNIKENPTNLHRQMQIQRMQGKPLWLRRDLSHPRSSSRNASCKRGHRQLKGARHKWSMTTLIHHTQMRQRKHNKHKSIFHHLLEIAMLLLLKVEILPHKSLAPQIVIVYISSQVISTVINLIQMVVYIRSDRVNNSLIINLRKIWEEIEGIIKCSWLKIICIMVTMEDK